MKKLIAFIIKLFHFFFPKKELKKKPLTPSVQAQQPSKRIKNQMRYKNSQLVGALIIYKNRLVRITHHPDENGNQKYFVSKRK